MDKHFLPLVKKMHEISCLLVGLVLLSFFQNMCILGVKILFSKRMEKSNLCIQAFLFLVRVTKTASMFRKIKIRLGQEAQLSSMLPVSRCSKPCAELRLLIPQRIPFRNSQVAWGGGVQQQVVLDLRPRLSPTFKQDLG